MSRKPLCSVSAYPLVERAVRDMDEAWKEIENRSTWLKQQMVAITERSMELKKHHWKKIEEALYEAGLLKDSFFTRGVDVLHYDDDAQVISYCKADDSSDSSGMAGFLEALASAAMVKVTRVETTEKKPD